MDRYNVVWDTPSEDCYGSMPIGNGDIGLNLWAQDEGGLYFYISKTDSWSENNRLLKLGRVHVGMSPNPFARGKPFKQTLHLRNAEILIEAGEEAERVSLRVWVDANHPVIHVEIEGKSDITLRVDMEMWRTHRREITDRGEKDSGTPPVLIVEPDTVVSDEADRIVWYHRNERSMWEDNMRLTLMDEMIPSSTDPLLHRTFGAAIEGEGLVKAGDLSLVSAQPGRSFSVDIFPLTSQTDTAGQWLDELDRQIEAVRAVPKDTRLAAHRQWWDDFWNRSWIFVTYCWDSFAITQGYALQRFINACGGRGAHPIKFNGSIFTVDAWPDLPRADGTYADADYRRWGGSYWLYNQRIAYYCMFECGDFELLMPFFKMYVDSLELNKHRTRKYHGHDGVSFPEIMHFWGNITTPDYAWEDRESVPERIVNESFYLFWEGGLELATMMIDCFQYTQDRQFAASMMLPLAAEVIKGYDQHWGRDENGTYRLFPACLGETKPDIVNPAPDIAGLKFVLGQLLDLPEDLTTQEQRSEWSRFRGELPELATRELNGLKLLAQAEKMPDPGYQTDGNAGLFAVHPFRLFGVGKEGLDTAVLTFANRFRQSSYGHQQEAIQAAMLGISITAGQDVEFNSKLKDPYSRFPAFWGANFDYVPDQCHGGTTMTALQRMLIHSEGRKIILFPAWPHFWEVDFKLHAPYNTTIEGTYTMSEGVKFKVTPEERTKDVICMKPQ